MRKATKTRVRIRGGVALTTYTRMQRCFSYIQGTTDWHEWTYKMVSQRQIASLMAGGDVEPITRKGDDGTVQTVGYRATRPIRQSDVSPACLNARTMAVAAMKPTDTFSRGDIAQLEKFRLWPFIGDDRATCVRPRPTAIETGFLDTLLAAGRLGTAPKLQAAA